VTTFGLFASCCLSPGGYWREPYPKHPSLATVLETTILDSSGRPRLARARTVEEGPLSRRASSLYSGNSSNSQLSTRPRRNSQPTTPLSIVEKIDLGPSLPPWHKDHPHRLNQRRERRHSYGPKYNEYEALCRTYVSRHEQITKQRELAKKYQLQRRKSSRQLDGSRSASSRSASSSPAISRTNSQGNLPRTNSQGNLPRTNSQGDLPRSNSLRELARDNIFANLKRSNSANSTAPSIASSNSGRSTNSKRSGLRQIIFLGGNDRDTQRDEAWKEQQLRESSIGANGKPNSPSDAGQGVGRLPGKHSDKSTR
jgi:hypothetical protein